jgi:hypothetical protein
MSEQGTQLGNGRERNRKIRRWLLTFLAFFLGTSAAIFCLLLFPALLIGHSGTSLGQEIVTVFTVGVGSSAVLAPVSTILYIMLGKRGGGSSDLSEQATSLSTSDVKPVDLSELKGTASRASANWVLGYIPFGVMVAFGCYLYFEPQMAKQWFGTDPLAGWVIYVGLALAAFNWAAYADLKAVMHDDAIAVIGGGAMVGLGLGLCAAAGMVYHSADATFFKLIGGALAALIGIGVTLMYGRLVEVSNFRLATIWSILGTLWLIFILVMIGSFIESFKRKRD